MRLDIYEPVRMRRQAIDWNSLHVTSDSRADAGMFRRRVPLIERVVGLLRGAR